MSKKKQTLIYSLLFIAIVLPGVVVLEVGQARTVSASPGGGPSTDSRKSEAVMPLPQTSHPAFTLTASRSAIREGGQARLVSTLQRFQRSDGLFKLVVTFYTPEGATNGVQTNFGFIGLGVFRLDESRRRLIFTGPQVDDAPSDVEQFLRGNPLFTRAESVGGVTAIVWRKTGRAEGAFEEEYRAPALGGLLIKRVKVSPRGREMVEPSAIQMGEPAPGLFSELFLYPVDYANYEQGIMETERNEPEIAGLMRQLLERMRQVRPGGSSGQ